MHAPIFSAGCGLLSLAGAVMCCGAVWAQAPNLTVPPGASSQRSSRTPTEDYDHALHPYKYGLGGAESALATPWSRVLLVPSGPADDDKLSSLNEDLRVMCMIFDRLLTQAGLQSEVQSLRLLFLGDTPNWFTNAAPAGCECLYVEGYGPLFVLSVDFPLSPPAQEQPETNANEPADPLWNQVWQETYSPEGARGRAHDEPQDKYSPAKAKLLEETLVRAFRHAANIRGLDGDTWLTVAVRSPSRHTADTSDFRYEGMLGRRRAPVAGASATLILRAKMEHVMTLASGEVAFDAFRKQVETTKY